MSGRKYATSILFISWRLNYLKPQGHNFKPPKHGNAIIVQKSEHFYHRAQKERTNDT